MIGLEFDNGKVVIKGEKEDLQPLVDFGVISKDILESGGLSLTTRDVVFKVITDLDKIIDGIVGPDLVTNFRQLFPEGYSEIHEKPFRGNLQKCIANMKKFKKEYKFKDEVILEATKKMIDRQISKGKKDWIPQAHFFIYHRDRGSDLANECENVLNGTSTERFSKWK